MATLRFKVGGGSWADQFKDCFYANGKPDWSEAESLDTRSDPTMMDYALHFVTFPWKVMIYPSTFNFFFKDVPSHTEDAVKNNNEIFTCASILIRIKVSLLHWDMYT